MSPCLPSRLNRRCLGDHVRHMLVLHDYLTTKKVGLNKEEWVGGGYWWEEGRESGERNVLRENSSEGCRDKGAKEKHLNLGCIYITGEVEQSQGATTSKWRRVIVAVCHYTSVPLLHSSGIYASSYMSILPSHSCHPLMIVLHTCCL